jgi:2-desacetyl-2-hydroxyethyl bacteriochlorophyllide A dehydrogenase
MQAAVYAGIRDLRIERVPDPTPTPDDIVMHIKACGICGSDLHSYTTGAFIKPGQIMGHEFCGEVVAVGSHVQGLQVGDRVTAMPFNACYNCPACLQGAHHLCYNLGGMAIAYGLPGAFAEYLRVPRATLGRNVFRLPETLSDLAGATIEPLSVALHAVRLANPDIAARVVVIGAGLIGQCMIQVLKARGVETIVVSEISAKRAAMARQSGADVVLDPSAGDFLQQVGDCIGYGPNRRSAAADVVFDCAGVPAAFDQAVRLVRPGGTLAITALYEEPVQLHPSRLVWSEIKLLGTFGYRDEFPQTIRLLERGKVHVEALVTDCFPLAQISDGFVCQMAKDQAMKVMIQP